jgi:3D (Asp-Asp-Asp) domain-containing protein
MAAPAWQRVVGQLLGIAAMLFVGFTLLWYGSESLRPLPPAPQAAREALPNHAPVIVRPEQMPAGAAPVKEPFPAARHPVFSFDFGLDKPLLLRRRLPVQITMYCLQGTTRSGLPVRDGIVAADTRLLPLGTEIDLYVGLKYYGRFLVDDTGGVIKGPVVDIWTPSCAEARRFGRRRGAVVLVNPTKQKRRR